MVRNFRNGDVNGAGPLAGVPGKGVADHVLSRSLPVAGLVGERRCDDEDDGCLGREGADDVSALRPCSRVRSSLCSVASCGAGGICQAGQDLSFALAHQPGQREQSGPPRDARFRPAQARSGSRPGEIQSKRAIDALSVRGQWSRQSSPGERGHIASRRAALMLASADRAFAVGFHETLRRRPRQRRDGGHRHLARPASLTSAPTGQIRGFDQWTFPGSSKPPWSEDEQEIRKIEGRH